MKKECLIIVFQSKSIDIEYKVVEENGTNPRIKAIQKANLYDLVPNFYLQKNKFGKETQVLSNNGELTTFLEKFNKDFTYENIFVSPTIWNNEKRVPDPYFYPLMINSNNEIISYTYITHKQAVFIFPVLEDNSDFIISFLNSIAPSIKPVLFPYSSKNKWTENDIYALPNQKKLIEERNQIEEDFKKLIEEKNNEIVLNYDKYSFLHKILTETGDELVSAIIKFLEWLGFENVKDKDTEADEIKEEDIQIENSKGLLVVEVKGIGGTSKDSECSQISKIKYRRAKERGKFDVYGLYIVNHQKHIPAFDRENPPFTKEQIQDAVNDERGLLTTWTLFNLYYDIQDGILSKDEARENFYNYGLILFPPQNIIFIDTINEIFIKGEVFILNLNGITIKVGDTLFIEKNGKFQNLTITEIRLNDQIATQATNGEVGIKGTKKVSKNSKVWMKNQM